MPEPYLPIDVILPKDLAEMLDDLVTEPIPTRSTLLSLFASGAVDASIAITFLQGPPAFAYWVDITKKWLQRKRGSGIGELKLKGPGGTATFVVTADTDLAELAGTLHRYMFPSRRKLERDVDDIAV